ncbi:hypothetical protein [uncultured Methanospirillum sp.]|uniref:hypothetical protein n=1 Tax=uncultured Methanospirillum sp. TaxID=262503 RepID=UPI0029C98448|nr:hypothetical protein [uncultured Methanospirillum sp.]
MVLEQVSDINPHYKKYMPPKAISLTGNDTYIDTCVSGAGDIGCGTGLSAAYDCVTNGASAQVSRPYRDSN